MGENPAVPGTLPWVTGALAPCGLKSRLWWGRSICSGDGARKGRGCRGRRGSHSLSPGGDQPCFLRWSAIPPWYLGEMLKFFKILGWSPGVGSGQSPTCHIVDCLLQPFVFWTLGFSFMPQWRPIPESHLLRLGTHGRSWWMGRLLWSGPLWAGAVTPVSSPSLNPEPGGVTAH